MAMKRFLPLILIVFALQGRSQITTPVVKAGFGVDGDLRANFFNGATSNGNDDWFRNVAGTGVSIIDTAGATRILSRYNTLPISRGWSFTRGMAYPQMSIVNNRLLMDGIFIRDYHGDDSSVFASGANKNAMSPANWNTPPSQGIPDKNDILDTYLHIRREGTTLSDSMWLMGGISIDATDGSKYFDFELYQTDITYDKQTLKFKNYGPQNGHTAWQFDNAGNVIKAGDAIFSANFKGQTLESIEAYIWVDSATLTINPAAFKWGGAFERDQTTITTFGYARIIPKTAGSYYTGTQCVANTWAGAFAVVLQDNTVSQTYFDQQFMEISVNLTKLGLDPWVYSTDRCKLPFSKVLVKTRSSGSFTAQLKDFVAPFSFFQPPRVDAAADIPILCGVTGISTLSVSNPLPASLYSWRTTNGNITSTTQGPTITVDKPGTYIVDQLLMNGCKNTYASDTITVTNDPFCQVLKSSLKQFQASKQTDKVVLQWTVTENQSLYSFEIQRSTDDKNFISAGTLKALGVSGDLPYIYTDDISDLRSSTVYYRLKITDRSGGVTYSRITALYRDERNESGFSILPNPVQSKAYIAIQSINDKNEKAEISILNQSGFLIRQFNVLLSSNNPTVPLENMEQYPPGVYVVKVSHGGQHYIQRMVLTR
jgi:hypothetical protein